MTESSSSSYGELIELVAELRSGRLAIHDYLDRLKQRFDSREQSVHAFLPEPDRFDRLREESKALYFRHPRPDRRPSLFGVPVAVKDIFHVEGFPTRAGSRLPEDRLASPEARSVTRLKQAGALILGKTITTEFAYFAPGPTRNPHHKEHTPGGSSSGSAAAVGAGMTPLALGTQTIGSITRPAAFCGVVGYKPSYERISREGVIPLAPSLDHIGAFTSDVSGAELVASTMIEGWSGAAFGEGLPVLGVPVGTYLERTSPEGMAAFDTACDRLAQAGYAIERIPAMPDFDEIVERHQLILAAEAAQVHRKWFDEFESLYDAKTAELIRRGREIDPAQLPAALAGRTQLRQTLSGLMDRHGLDGWIAPSATGPAPLGLESTGDPIMNLPWTHCGLPTLNIPSGFSEKGLPLGAQLVGRWAGDGNLFAWARGVEAVLNPQTELAA